MNPHIPAEWALDREVVLTRVIAASPAEVYAAWTDGGAMGQWFGPDDFGCAVHSMDVREGGRSTFDLVASDGTVYTNRVDYLTVVPQQMLMYDHGSDIDDDPSGFRVTVTFDAQADGKTVLTMRQLHPTAERRNAIVGFGAVELGFQTLAKLAAYLAQ